MARQKLIRHKTNEHFIFYVWWQFWFFWTFKSLVHVNQRTFCRNSYNQEIYTRKDTNDNCRIMIIFCFYGSKNPSWLFARFWLQIPNRIETCYPEVLKHVYRYFQFSSSRRKHLKVWGGFRYFTIKKNSLFIHLVGFKPHDQKFERENILQSKNRLDYEIIRKTPMRQSESARRIICKSQQYSYTASSFGWKT